VVDGARFDVDDRLTGVGGGRRRSTTATPSGPVSSVKAAARIGSTFARPPDRNGGWGSFRGRESERALGCRDPSPFVTCPGLPYQWRSRTATTASGRSPDSPRSPREVDALAFDERPDEGAASEAFQALASEVRVAVLVQLLRAERERSGAPVVR